MPEGPEVQRQADQLDDALAGKRIVEFSTRMKKAKAWLAAHPDLQFEGQTVRRVWAHGKHLIGEVTGDLFFQSHFMMWGRWHLHPPDAEPVVTPDRRERARIVTDDVAALLYSAPVFHVGRGDPYAHVPGLADLGPDTLPLPDAAPFDAAEMRRRMLATDRKRRQVGAVLLDQTVIAGIGNYLRADILFLCRIDPWTLVDDLTEHEWTCLGETIPAVVRHAYETKGRTVTDAEQQRMMDDPTLVYNEGRAWNTRHYTFRRTNLPCLRCGTPIKQKRQVTRITPDDEEKTRIIYFCPVCQGVASREGESGKNGGSGESRES